MLKIFAGCWRSTQRSLIFALVLFCAAQALWANVDPALVGKWQASGTNERGPWKLVWDVSNDGRYAVGGSLTDAGFIVACGGRLIEISGTTRARVQATYLFSAPNQVVTTGRAVPISLNWRRISASVAAAKTSSCQIPDFASAHPAPARVPKLENVPAQSANALAIAQRWRKDAELVLVEIESDYANNQRIGHYLQFYFKSPATKAGLILAPSQPASERAMFVGGDNMADGVIPLKFIDFPGALMIAQQHGMKGGLKEAVLMIHRAPGSNPILAWTLTPDNGDNYSIDAAGGRFLGANADLDGYVAQYNKDWAAAGAALRTALQAAVNSLPKSTTDDTGNAEDAEDKDCPESVMVPTGDPDVYGGMVTLDRKGQKEMGLCPSN